MKLRVRCVCGVLEEAGGENWVDVIKTHYMHLWSFHRINKNYLLRKRFYLWAFLLTQWTPRKLFPLVSLHHSQLFIFSETKEAKVQGACLLLKLLADLASSIWHWFYRLSKQESESRDFHPDFRYELGKPCNMEWTLMAALEMIIHESVRVKSDSRTPQEVRDARTRLYLFKRGHRQQGEKDLERNYTGSNCEGTSLPKPLETHIPQLCAQTLGKQLQKSTLPILLSFLAIRMWTVLLHHFYQEPWYIFISLCC